MALHGFQGSEPRSSCLHRKHSYPLSHLPRPVYALSSPGGQRDGFHLLATVNNEALKYKVLCDTGRCGSPACSRFVCLSCGVSCNNIGILTSICSYKKKKKRATRSLLEIVGVLQASWGLLLFQKYCVLTYEGCFSRF